MKFYHNENNGLTIEDGNGGKVVLTSTEADILYINLRSNALWEDVAMRYDEHPQWSEIEQSKEDILDCLYEELAYRTDDVVSDAVHYAVERWVDLDEDKED